MITLTAPPYFTPPDKPQFSTAYVLTHDGVFHADEVFAIALLHLYHKEIVVTRSRDEALTKRMLQRPDVWVLDTGNTYDPPYHNFDHHQEDAPAGMATAGMVFTWLFPNHGNDPVMARVHRQLIRPVSDQDLGNFTGKEGLYQVSVLISAFNKPGSEQQADQFIRAVHTAYSFLANEIHKGEEEEKCRKTWAERTMIAPHTVLLSAPCLTWKSLAARNGDIRYVLLPAEEKEEWQLWSTDNEKFPLPPPGDPGEALFIHRQRFLIVFSQKAQALTYVGKYLLSS